MRISQLTGTLGAAAAIALLAGCSGGSQYAPSATAESASGTMGTTSISHHGMRRVPMPFASKLANETFLHRPIVNNETGRITFAKDTEKCKAAERGLTFASDNATGALDVFCGAKGNKHITSGQTPFMSIAGVAGWGLAVHGNRLAVGDSNGTILLYTLPNFPPPAIMTLDNAGDNAYGLAFDHLGGLYATEWPGPYVDYWRPQTLFGSPFCEVTTTINTVDYFVAADTFNTVVVYGYNGNSSEGDVDTEVVTGPHVCTNITDTFGQTFGQLDEGTGFPGGIVSDHTGELFVNNQYGELYDDGTYPGGPISATCSWGYNPNDVTNINMASNQHSIWGTNTNFGSSTLQTSLESFKSSIGSGTCTTGAVGGPTVNMANDEYLGVASWPNVGN